ncbi:MULTISPECIES: Abi family protein [unclassified Endozoicomonas]|uniref:Abi family protein n=1 Tax=unclassified Endozoicomonas TaxID=2644528 RepID=UPI002148D4EA|nr:MULTISPECIES: Abi family protein [unclassified Endozoicomonas]
MVYERPWKTFQQQLDLLVSRNLVVSDEAAALNHLQRIGYYRLSAYLYPFRVFRIQPNFQVVKENEFVANTHFSDAVNLYIFDKNLRQLMLDALERIEVALRVDIAYLLGERDTYAYKNIDQFHPTFAGKNKRHANWLKKYENLLKRSKEDFVKHYRHTHGADLPIWVAIEVWDFGAMSQLFSMMKVPDQRKISSKYGVTDFKVFSSWLRSLNYLRNLCAHHSRLWNRNVIDQPKLPAPGEISWCDHYLGKNDLISKPFLLINIVAHLMSIICPATKWHDRLIQQLDEFPEIKSDRKVSINDIGLQDGWKGLIGR